MDFLRKIEALEAERAELKQALAVQGISEAREIAIRQQVVALDNQITAFTSQLAPPTKIVNFLDEDGEMCTTNVNSSAFDRWLDGSALVAVPVPGGGTESTKHVKVLADVEPSEIYRFVHQPVDVKACVQHLIDTQELEFGKACEQFVARRKEFHGFTVVKSNKAANPYAYRLDKQVEVDFYATKGDKAVAGMFQLTMPKNKKISRFFEDCKKLHPPANMSIFGVSLVNPAALQNAHQRFTAVLVRSAVGFCVHGAL